MQLDPNLLLIDIRRKEELAGPLGKISRARHVPLRNIKTDPEQFPKNRTLVLICRSGNRSLEGAKILARHGYVVYTLEGGMRGWTAMQSENRATPPAPSREIHKQVPEVPEDNRPKHKFFGQDMGC
ncbi:MAG: rhodanese-like domain-containing protein [Desulfohalobiaceae bacterium]|nr:rhodanese-like domain-containing protein [Desulfohalobiaceae bacterium]